MVASDQTLGVAADPEGHCRSWEWPQTPVVAADLGDMVRHQAFRSLPSILSEPPSLPSLEFEPFSRIHLISQAH